MIQINPSYKRGANLETLIASGAILSRNDTDYMMDTFPIVRMSDEKAHRVILEIYDAMAEAARSVTSYQTRLDPPPADPRVAHPDTHTAAEKKGQR